MSLKNAKKNKKPLATFASLGEDAKESAVKESMRGLREEKRGSGRRGLIRTIYKVRNSSKMHHFVQNRVKDE